MKRFITLGPGGIVIKLFTDISYKFSYWAIVFILLAKDKHYRVVVFADKAGAYQSETLFRCSTLG